MCRHLPGLSPIWISPRLADAVAQEASCPAPRVANVGFNEPSYIFLQGTDTLPTSAEGAARFLVEADPEPGEGATARCRMAVVDALHEAAFLAALTELGAPREKSTVRVTGLNINGGDELDIGLYSAEETGRE